MKPFKTTFVKTNKKTNTTMKAIIFIIFMIPVSVMAQIGITAGYITKGFNAGIAYQSKLNNGQSAYIEAEVLYNNTSIKYTGVKMDRNGRPVTNSLGNMITEDKKLSVHSIMLPISVKIRYNKSNIKPILRSGIAPVLDLSNSNHSLSAIMGGGVIIKDKFQVEGRYIQELTNSTIKRYSLVSISASFYLL